MHETDNRLDIAILARPFTGTDATELVRRADAANEALYGHPDQTPLEPDEFDPANKGQFLIAYLHHKPVACGGYRGDSDDRTGRTAEIKRIYVRPEVRRQRIAQQILSQLEHHARDHGYSRIILDVGGKQSPAHQLYECSGYTQIPGFSIYRDSPGNRAYGKDL